MAIEQVKPEVSHYRRIEVNGEKRPGSAHWNKDELYEVAESDLKKHGVKTKFRPVYKKTKAL